MAFTFVTKDVSKFDKFKCTKDEQLVNKPFIFVIDVVSNLDISKDVNFLQSKNILSIYLRADVSKFDKFK